MKKEEQVILEVDGFEFFSNKEVGNNRGPKREASAKPALPLSQNKERTETDRFVAYPRDTRAALSRMTDRYAKSSRAQNVSFRKLVSWLKVGERATHYLHSYPAKLLPQIAHFFLAASHLTKPGDTVLDPFGGSGTVALEAILSGRNGLFADVNPLAQLIARVKTRPINPARLEAARTRVQLRYAGLTTAQLPTPEVVNLTYWYSGESIASLNKIKAAIDLERRRDVREFLLVAFSGACRKVSRADPRLSVPVRLKEIPADKAASAPDVWSVFDEQLKNNIRRMQVLTDCLADHTFCRSALFAGNDARVLKQGIGDLKVAKARLRKNSVALIITSPPYAGAQKYVRAASLNLGWLGLTKVDGLKPLENATIGREHFRKDSLAHCVATEIPAADRLIKRVHAINPLRAVIISTYLNEMNDAISEMARVLKPGGHLVMVIGNNEVCGLPFKSSEYLLTLCERHGLQAKLRLIDEIKSRGLMTKRNKTASVITREWVLLLEKPSQSSDVEAFRKCRETQS